TSNRTRRSICLAKGRWEWVAAVLRRIPAAEWVAAVQAAREVRPPLVPWVLVALRDPQVPVVLLDLPIQPADSDPRDRNHNRNPNPTHHRNPIRHPKVIPPLPEGLAHDRS
ncbi:MAG: hypothetical protein N2039_06660, partial [Gemmataceae bacterium]|nr:hypothetical protein [Gemmataceae bacterium]